MELNVIAFVLSLLLTAAVLASPFNDFLRAKFFSDGYRWRGLDRHDSVPLTKTLILFLTFLAGVIYEGLVLAHSARTSATIFAWILLVGVFGNGILSIWFALRKRRRARRRLANSI
jgi:UDP-N-acetylmuramyl pentapeptide phosphotransferase/UDP-N-acetylglucosamine-1-phosphate transferase